MRNNNHEISTHNTYEYAIMKGHLDTIQWLKSHDYETDINLSYISAKYGQLHILQWLHTNNYIKTNEFTQSAAEYGYENILQWALDQKYDIDINNFKCNITLRNGYINVLEWLINHKYHFDKLLHYDDVCKCSENTLRWVMANGYKLCDTFINDVIFTDNIDILRWAISIGYKLTDVHYEKIFKDKNIIFLEFLLKNKLLDYPIMIGCDSAKHIYLTDIKKKIFINISAFSADVIPLILKNIKTQIFDVIL